MALTQICARMNPSLKIYQKEPVQKEPHEISNMDYVEVALLPSICPIFDKLSLYTLSLRYVLAIFITKKTTPILQVNKEWYR